MTDEQRSGLILLGALFAFLVVDEFLKRRSIYAEWLRAWHRDMTTHPERVDELRAALVDEEMTAPDA